MTLFCEQCSSYLGPNQPRCLQCGWERPPFNYTERGQAVWSQPGALPGQPRGQPVFSHGLVLVAWVDGKCAGGVSAFDLGGGLSWQVGCKETPLDGLLVDGERVYFATAGLIDSGSVYCCQVDAGDPQGRVLWRQNRPEVFPSRISGAPLLLGNRLYIPCQGGHIVCLDANLKDPIPGWAAQAGSDVRWLTMADGYLLAADRESGDLYFIDPIRGGQASLKIALGSRLACNLIRWQEHWFVCTADGRVLQVDLRQRRVEEFARGLGKLVAAPAIANGWLVCPAGDHSIYAWDAKGHFAWQSGPLSQHSLSSPAVLHNVVAVGANDGHVYALDLHSGDYLWGFDSGTGQGMVQDVLAQEETFYIAVNGGKPANDQLFALPWHLGEYEKVAKKNQGMENYALAAELFALASYSARRKEERDDLCGRAAANWIEAGKPHLAAAFWESLARFDQAATHWQAAAELARGRDNLKAAEYSYRAARLYWRLGDPTNEDRCAADAADLANWPRLRILVLNNPIQVIGKPGLLTVRLENIGCSPAQNLHFDVGGSLVEPIGFNLLEPLAQERHCDFSFLITPTREEDNVRVEVTYFSKEHLLPFKASIEVSVIARRVTQVKIGDMVMGEVKIYNDEGREIEIQTGDMVRSKVEIIMAKS